MRERLGYTVLNRFRKEIARLSNSNNVFCRIEKSFSYKPSKFLDHCPFILPFTTPLIFFPENNNFISIWIHRFISKEKYTYAES